jgi:putative tricarboxylic transport membrane protein
MLMQPAEAGEQIKAGNMRVIGAITDHRLPLFPDVPTLKEQGLDIPILPQARGAVAPPGVSREIVEYWEGAFGRLVKTASWKKYLAENHLEDGFLKGRELREFTDQYTNRKRVILQEAGAKVVR